MTAIEIHNVCKQYRGKKGRVVRAVEGISFSVERGEVFGFLGPNGAGKSTTIKMIMGLVSPSSGSVRLCGVAASDSNARRKVGFLPENPSFYDVLTAREYLYYVGQVFGMKSFDIVHATRRVLELLDLTNAADRPLRGYSKGMVQRLGIAQAMIHDPDVYIFDEPMSGLDPLGRVLVKEIIRDLRKNGKTVFFSTHITNDVEVICDRVGIVAGGKLLAVHAVDTVLEAGLEGYQVRVRGCCDLQGDGVVLREASEAVAEYYVERSAFDSFVSAVSHRSGRIELVEPHRKDLEAFFLDVVSGNHEKS